jgi:hypothetical protein
MIKSKGVIWEGHVAEWGRIELHTGFSWGNCKRPLGRPRRRWNNNIKIDLKTICEAVGCTDVA